MLCPNCGLDLSLIGKRGKTSPENRLFHALCNSLAMARGVPMELMKRYIKLCAATAHGYDCETTTIEGHTVQEPKSIARATNDDMINKLIPTCYELGMDWGIPLEQPGGA
jgi:hypothetical protein